MNSNSRSKCKVAGRLDLSVHANSYSRRRVRATSTVAVVFGCCNLQLKIDSIACVGAPRAKRALLNIDRINLRKMWSGRTLLAFASVAGSNAQMTKMLFPPNVVTQYGGRCLDGSAAGYFFQPGTGGGSNSFAIFLQGGGACYTNVGTSDVNCFVRMKEALGSSKYWPSTLDDESNILANSPTANPDFYNWNHIFVPYCSGDVHLGMQTAIVNSSFPFYFAGHNIVDAVIDSLINTTTIAHADNVLFAGSSAGGIGTFANADFVSSKLPGAKRFRANPQGGWFYPETVSWDAFLVNDFAPPYGTFAPLLQQLWNPFVMPACAENAGNKTFCMSIGNYYQYINTPLFVTENQADSNQIFVQEGCPLVSNATVDAYVEYYIAQMRASVAQVYQHNGNKTDGKQDGLFFPACVGHTENTGLVSSTVVNNTSIQQSLGSWFFDRADGILTLLADSCAGIDCNPTCPPLPLALDLQTAAAAPSGDRKSFEDHVGSIAEQMPLPHIARARDA